MKLRTVIKAISVHLPIIDRLFYEVRYRQVKDKKTIRAKMQQVAHRIDLRVSQNAKAPYDAIKEFEFFMDKVRWKNVSIDEALFWALAIYAIGRHRLQSEYVQSLENTQSSIKPSCGKADLVASIRERRSIRKWTDDPIDCEDIKEIIDVAKWAPSSCNSQLWQILLINKQRDKEFLLEFFHHKFWLHAPLLVVILMDTEPYHKIEKHYPYLDGGAFIQNMLLVLHARGYGACWIGFAKWDTLGNMHINRRRHERFYEYFKLKKGIVPVSMIAVGKPGIKPKAPPRQDINNIVIKSFLE
jgi:nitroreductase